MTDPVAPSFIVAKSTDDGTTKLINFYFFPDIHLLDFQQRYRLDAGTKEERQIQNLITAMQSVNNELLNPNSTDDELGWVGQQFDKGYCSLDKVPSLHYGQCKEKSHQYLTAVYAYAKGLLMQRYRDTDSTRIGGTKGRDLESTNNIDKTAEDYFQESREAIRSIMDKSRCTIELI